jgi:CDP-glucose 4,6-dehydratase
MGVNRAFWRGRRVFLTGHTGFKGAWLALWLADAGAEVHGFALASNTAASFFSACNLEKRLAKHTTGDVRDAAALREALAVGPDVILHLAAQALVLTGYEDPVGTYATNVLGTVNLLEAVRHQNGRPVVINVTSDKCYENREGGEAFHETDRLGGRDPYSSSKACSELVTEAYRRSFLSAIGVATATARAGNVIGGGDWSANRLLPDFFRAIEADQELVVRSPRAVRPWQHVLEPLSGYLTLAEALADNGSRFANAYNFGPAERDAKPVAWIAEQLCRAMPGARWRAEPSPEQPHEAAYLKLNSERAQIELGWRPRWSLEEALAKTVQWHCAWRSGRDMTEVSLLQIRDYESAA